MNLRSDQSFQVGSGCTHRGLLSIKHGDICRIKPSLYMNPRRHDVRCIEYRRFVNENLRRTWMRYSKRERKILQFAKRITFRNEQGEKYVILINVKKEETCLASEKFLAARSRSRSKNRTASAMSERTFQFQYCIASWSQSQSNACSLTTPTKAYEKGDIIHHNWA